MSTQSTKSTKSTRGQAPASRSRVVIKLTASLWRQIKVRAAEEGCTASDFVAAACVNHLARTKA